MARGSNPALEAQMDDYWEAFDLLSLSGDVEGQAMLKRAWVARHGPDAAEPVRIPSDGTPRERLARLTCCGQGGTYMTAEGPRDIHDDEEFAFGVYFCPSCVPQAERADIEVWIGKALPATCRSCQPVPPAVLVEEGGPR